MRNRTLKFRVWSKQVNQYIDLNTGKEMNDLDNTILCSIPPRKNIGCECGFRDYRIA